jgi:hypothetical protein
VIYAGFLEQDAIWLGRESGNGTNLLNNFFDPGDEGRSYTFGMPDNHKIVRYTHVAIGKIYLLVGLEEAWLF